jgi:hypothetical protein
MVRKLDLARYFLNVAHALSKATIDVSVHGVSLSAVEITFKIIITLSASSSLSL